MRKHIKFELFVQQLRVKYSRNCCNIQGPNPDEKPASGGSVTDSKPPSSTSGASTEKVSTDKYRNYAVVAGVITLFGAAGWYLKSKDKKAEVQD